VKLTVKDCWNMAETERLRCYFPLERHSLVLDIGGYTGEWASRMLDFYGCRMEVFEPVEEYASAARRTLIGTGAHVHEFGLGAVCEERLIQPDLDATQTQPGEDGSLFVRMERAADAFERLSIRDADLMKVNIEGGEYELMPHLLDAGWLPRVRFLLIQWHRTGPWQAIGSLRQRIEQTHELLWSFPWVWEAWQRVDQ